MPQPSFVNVGTHVRSTITPTTGVNVTFPAGLVAGNLLVIHACHANASNLVDDVYDATAANQQWTLGFHDGYFDAALGMDHYMWWKFCTGGESGNVKINATTIVGVAGASVMSAVMYQFANVYNPGTATFIEATSVTNSNASGPPSAVNITTTGADRLAVMFYARAALGTQVTSPPGGEIGGDWLIKAWSPTTHSRFLTLFTATMSVAGTIQGGVLPGTHLAVGGLGRMIHGVAFAPCGGAAGISRIPYMMHHYMMTRAQHG